MNLKEQYEYFKSCGDRPKVMVVSHERSGTHFLMNSLEKCFLYDSKNFFNFDEPQLSINFYAKDSIKEFAEWFSNNQDINNKVIKSHHPFDFFDGVLNEYKKHGYAILYIYRNPLDVMVSSRFLNKGFNWYECPDTENVSEFIRTTPAGRCTRYQYKAEENFLKRWETHVNGWLNEDVIPVKYEDLKERYEDTIKYISQELGFEPYTIEKPSRDENVIKAKNQPESYNDVEHRYSREDIIYISEQIGDTMKKLGYL